MIVSDKHKQIFAGDICPYCERKSELESTSFGYRYICKPCDAYVGCHEGSKSALGRLANKELRSVRMEAHRCFDRIWKSSILGRKDAYKWLSEQLNIPEPYCHIGYFKIDTCKKVIEHSRKLFSDFSISGKLPEIHKSLSDVPQETISKDGIQLRKNQVEPVRIGIEFLKQKKSVPSIIVMPTAAGKSVIIGFIAKGINEKILILQPSKELLQQNFNKFIALGGTASVYSASFKSKKVSDVTYATIGSIKSVGKLFKEMGIIKLIIDEADRYPRGEDTMIGRFLADSEIKSVLGLTATPLKLQTNSFNMQSFSILKMLTSRSKHGNFFKEIIYVSQISEMVELGYWSKLHYEQYDIDKGKLVFNSTKAEYTEASIKAVYQTNNTETKIIAKLQELSHRRSILIAVPSVADAKQLASIVPNSCYVCADMPSKDRDEAIKGFKSLKIKHCFNVNVLTVGFDHPELDTLLCARVTASLSWYYQFTGRGTRIHKNKKDCLIVDFSGNVKRFGKVEKLYFKKEGFTWKLYGDGGKLLTGVPMHEIGEHTEITERNREEVNTKVILDFGIHKGKEVKDTPEHWRKWAKENIKPNHYNRKFLKEIDRLEKV